ncbi:MAG: hypothetical protein JW797_01165 [Bradymonadales bacterium]|nr:hypothetical protein [Bradymonadales bacterium]
MKRSRNRLALALFLELILCTPGCQEESTPEGTPGDVGGDTSPDADLQTDPQADQPRPVCEPLTNLDCIEIQRGETAYHRWLVDYPTLQFDDEGTLRTVVPLADLVDEEVAADPDAWRYQVYGTDGFTFGGFATWTNMLNGYIELTTRKVVFDPSQELPRSYRVKDAYLIVLSPAS